MNNRLTRYKLGQLIEVTRGQSLLGDYYAEKGDRVRLTLANFDYQNGGFKENAQKNDIYYTGPVRSQFILNKGDIITPLTEQTPGLLGSTARIPESHKYVQSGDVALVKCNEDVIDPSFCYYLLPSSQVKKQLAAGSQQTKIRHTSPDAIKNCIVDIPDLDQQRKIGRLLDTITAKIDENRRQYALLEKIAKGLFEYWFVQFDFPDEVGNPYRVSGGQMVWDEKLKREIPNGWGVKMLKDITKEDDIVQINPLLEPERVFKHLSFPSFDANRSYFEEYGSDIHSNKIMIKEEYILAAKLNPWIKRIVWGNGEDIICSTEFVVLNPVINSLKPFIYTLVNQKAFIDYCTITSTGTSHSQRRVEPEMMKQFKFAYDERTAILFGDMTKELYERQQSSVQQCIEHKRLRDTLLPLLMSGQVSIK